MTNQDAIGYDYHVFVSHNQAQKPWVRQLVERLRQHDLRVFFDEDSVALGDNIVLAIEHALLRSRHIVLVLSPESLASRWVALEWATSLYRDPSAASRFLIPVLRSDCEIPLSLAALKRLDARGDDLEAQVSTLLSSIDRESVSNTVDEVEVPVKTTHPVTAPRLLIGPPTPGGAIPFDSDFYIQRDEDVHLLSALKRGDLVVLLIGPRQSGKSSMAIRAISKLQAQGLAVVRVDFQSIGASDLKEVLLGIAHAIARATGIGPIDSSKFFGGRDYESLRAFDEVLTSCNQPLVVVLDEVDMLLGLENGSALARFLMYLRSHHDRRAIDVGRRNVKFLLSLMLDPVFLLSKKITYTSPANVGFYLSLSGFSKAEVVQLVGKYDLTLSDKECDTLYEFTGGQPFLVHQCAYLICQGVDLRRLVDEEERYSRRFGMHLYPLYYALRADDRTAKAFERFREVGRLPEYPIKNDQAWEMEAVGLVRYDEGADGYVFAADLYKRFFGMWPISSRRSR